MSRVRQWTMAELADMANRMEEVAHGFGLDPYPVIFDVVSASAIVEDIALTGMPTRYFHWSFGKAAQIAEFQRAHLGLEVAELVVNSNPSVARLVDSNPWSLQLLTVAHVIGHSDFFRHNRHFRNTEPERVFQKMRDHRRRLQELEHDPEIGLEGVEKMLDAAHAVRYVRPFPSSYENPSLLRFLAREALELTDWEREVLYIVDDETEYFAPQMVTKVLNEGWASYWHEKIIAAMPEIDRHTKDKIAFHHVNVVKRFPYVERGEWINPYMVGYSLFHDICQRWDLMARGKKQAGFHWDGKTGSEKIFFVRRFSDDPNAFLSYLTQELAQKLGLFRFGPIGQNLSATVPPQVGVLDIPDEEGWEAVRDGLVRHVGFGLWPSFVVESTNHRNRGQLYLRHVFEGRDLDAQETEATLRCVYRIWKNPVLLETKTRRSRKNYYYYCDEHGIRRGSVTNQTIKPFIG